MLLKYIVFNMNHNLRTASLYDIGSDTHLIRGCNVLTLIHVPKYANISQIQALCPKINTQNMELVYPCFWLFTHICLCHFIPRLKQFQLFTYLAMINFKTGSSWNKNWTHEILVNSYTFSLILSWQNIQVYNYYDWVNTSWRTGIHIHHTPWEDQ